MKKKLLKIFGIFNIVALNFKNVYATSNYNEIYNIGNNNKLFDVGGTVAGYIVYVGIILSVIMLMIKGIKWITSAPEGKAQAQKELIPWAVGIAILFTIRGIVQTIANFAQNNVNNLTL